MGTKEKPTGRKFGPNDQRYVWRRKGEALKPKNTVHGVYKDEPPVGRSKIQGGTRTRVVVFFPHKSLAQPDLSKAQGENQSKALNPLVVRAIHISTGFSTLQIAPTSLHSDAIIQFGF